MKHYSGKFVLRIPESLHAALSKEAKNSGLSLNLICKEYLLNAMSKKNLSKLSEVSVIPKGLIQTLQKEWNENLIGIVLFGSAVRNELTSRSDIDLLIVLNDAIPLDRTLYEKWNDKKLSPHFVHLPKTTQEAGSIWYEAAIEGVVLLENNQTIGLFLQKIRKAMAEGKVQRRVSHGHPYWIKLNS